MAGIAVEPPTSRLMPIEFTEDERAALIDLVVGTIEHDLFPHSPRTQRLRGILAKLRPVLELPSDEEADGGGDADGDAEPELP
jgi:hypothetical protein